MMLELAAVRVWMRRSTHRSCDKRLLILAKKKQKDFRNISQPKRQAHIYIYIYIIIEPCSYVFRFLSHLILLYVSFC